MSSSSYLQLAIRYEKAVAILPQAWPALHSDLLATKTAYAALRNELFGDDFDPEDPSLVSKLRAIIRSTKLVQSVGKSLHIVSRLPLPTQPRAGKAKEQRYPKLVIDIAEDACWLLHNSRKALC